MEKIKVINLVIKVENNEDIKKVIDEIKKVVTDTTKNTLNINICN